MSIPLHISMRSLFLLAGFFVISLAGTARADSVTLQFFLGGFDDIPEGSRGILVADTGRDGFDSVFLAGVEGTSLEVGETVANSDDVIIAVTDATSSGFDDAVGFMDTFSSVSYEDFGLTQGDPIQFFWFADNGTGVTVVPSSIGFSSFSDGGPDTGGDIGYTLPAAPGVYTLSHLEPSEGGAESLAPLSGIVGPISTQPEGGAFDGGAEVTLTIGTQGSAVQTFEWFEGAVGDESTPVGNDNSELFLPGVAYDSTYWVKVSDSSGSVSSAGALITVNGGGLRPIISWSNIPGAEWYNLYVQKDGQVLTNLWLEGNDSTSWQSAANLGAGNYSWWVRSWSGAGGFTDWTGGAEFSIGIIELLTPNGVQENEIWRPEFSWTRSLGAERYNLYIQRNGVEWRNLWIEGYENNSWIPDVDLGMGEYTFWVAPWSSEHLLGPYSSSLSFSVGMPEPLAPSGTVAREDSDTVELTWSASSRTEWVQIYLQHNGTSGQAHWVESPAESWIPSPGLASGVYNWWIQGWNEEDGISTWVQGPEFTVQGVEAIAPLGLISGTSLPEFQWEVEPGAVWYQLYVAGEGGVVFFGWIPAASSWTPTGDLLDGDYEWYIQSWRPVTGTGPWVGPMAFTIE